MSRAWAEIGRNTCLKGTGDLYKDPKSAFHAREDNYLLITARAGEPVLRAELKNLRWGRT